MQKTDMLRMLRDRRGATTIEYGVFLVFGAIVLLSGLSSIGGSLNGVFDKAGQAMAAGAPPKASGIAEVESVQVKDAEYGILKNHQ